MNFNYINDLKYKDKLQELYFSAFPEEERFPFWILEECSKEDNTDLYAIIDNNKFVGMCYIVNCDGAYYLMYLAVQEELRNKKYGSKILKDLKEKYKTLFLSIDLQIDEISTKRKNFYLRNRFYETNKYYEDTGVWYEVMCTDNEYEITEDMMMKRYTNMTNKPDLLNIISNTFNTKKVNLKEKNNNEKVYNYEINK